MDESVVRQATPSSDGESRPKKGRMARSPHYYLGSLSYWLSTSYFKTEVLSRCTLDRSYSPF